MSEQDIDLLPLGTGKGATAVYEGKASSSFVIRRGGSPVFLVDLGIGVTKSCLDRCGKIPDTLLITHNHSDHSGDLPVVLAVEAARGRRLKIVASEDVVERLKIHRLHELHSTGSSMDELADWVSVTAKTRVEVGGGLSVQLHRGVHSEACYGCLVFFEGTPLVAYSADSGFDQELYSWLTQAPVIVVDGRKKGTREHAGFDEISAFRDAHPECRVWVSCYGNESEAPADLDYLKPGVSVPLRS